MREKEEKLKQIAIKGKKKRKQKHKLFTKRIEKRGCLFIGLKLNFFFFKKYCLRSKTKLFFQMKQNK